MSHQVNTIATINIFRMSNITHMNFDITYYLVDTFIVDGVSLYQY